MHLRRLEISSSEISSSLKTFKGHLDVVLGSLLWASLLEQGLDQVPPEGPAKLGHSAML